MESIRPNRPTRYLFLRRKTARNHNLEAQAQALYKSWFVDFKPFRGGTFVDSGLGMIPEGWSVFPLGQIVEYSKKPINPQRFPDTDFIHFSLPAFDNA